MEFDRRAEELIEQVVSLATAGLITTQNQMTIQRELRTGCRRRPAVIGLQAANSDDDVRLFLKRPRKGEFQLSHLVTG